MTITDQHPLLLDNLKAQTDNSQYMRGTISVVDGYGSKGAKPRPFKQDAAIKQVQSWIYRAVLLNALAFATVPLRLYVRKKGKASQKLFDSSEHIPRLQELLELVNGRVPILIEMKCRGGNAARLAAAVAALLDVYVGPVGVMSFEPRAAHWFARHVPQQRRGLVISERASAFDRWRCIRTGTPQFLAIDRAVVADLRGALEDPSINAVVLHVDSRGGSVTASDAIYSAVHRLDKEKPVVACFGDVSASGGYYVACGARSIVASPLTITGSIGVFAMIPTWPKLTEMLSVGHDVVKNRRHADLYDPWTGLREDERAFAQESVAAMYDAFISLVAESCGLTKEEVHAVAEGRVWSGKAARSHRLIDGVGGMDACRRDLGEQRLEHEIIVGVDPLDIELAPPLALERLGREHAAEAAADDQNLLLLHRLCHGPLSLSFVAYLRQCCTASSRLAASDA